MAVQVDPIKPTLRAPGTVDLKLKYGELLSIVLQSCSRFLLEPLHPGHSGLLNGGMHGSHLPLLQEVGPRPGRCYPPCH